MEYDPISDFQSGFGDWLNKKNEWTWSAQDVIVLSVVAVLFLAMFLSNRIFSRYRYFVRVRRRERKKQEFLERLVRDSKGGEAETELFKRLVRYYAVSHPSAGAVPPTQLLNFTQSFFRMMRRLQYDKQGRLVIPELEKQIEMLPAQARDKLAEISVPAVSVVRAGLRASQENMSKAARIALNLIRLRNIKD